MIFKAAWKSNCEYVNVCIEKDKINDNIADVNIQNGKMNHNIANMNIENDRINHNIADVNIENRKNQSHFTIANRRQSLFINKKACRKILTGFVLLYVVLLTRPYYVHPGG